MHVDAVLASKPKKASSLQHAAKQILQACLSGHTTFDFPLASKLGREVVWA